METKHNVRLTASELGELWASYMNDSMSVQVLPYFINRCEDSQIKKLLQYALSLSQNHLPILRTIFESENFPIPIGFIEQDVDINAPRLYSDVYYLIYLGNMAKFGIAGNGLGITLVARHDCLSYFSSVLDDAKELHLKVTNLLLEKGVYVRPPYISIPEKVDFVKKQGFLTGYLGERRVLTGVEIAHLYLNMTNNIAGKALLMGFSRVTKSTELRKFFERGVDIAKKHLEVLHSILNEGDLPSPMTHDTDVLDSQVPPFSDKLMLFHTGLLSAAGIANFGGSISLSLRRDLVTHYSRLIAEAGQYAEDGANLMIKNGWMEEPPQADNHKELVYSK
jgi:ferritin-like metal-binding protein YciE